MLISCPECQHDVSDKAVSCPNCGYPMKQQRQSRPKKFRRLPNGFGSIKHLSGNRRNPYAAYPATKEWTGTSPKARHAVGYFATYNEAYQALAEYNKTGIDIEKKIITFSQIYEIFIEQYKKKDVSKSSINGYTSSYDKCKSLYNKQFSELRRDDFQAIFDEYTEYSVSTVNNIKKLFNQMYKIAIENDIVDRNYSSNAIAEGKETRKGVPFTENEIITLWEHSDDERFHPALIMIYCGYRIGELQELTIDGSRAVGGLKTDAGKERVVPIHSAVLPFVKSLAGINKNTYPEKFREIMVEMGMEYAATGDRHTCHDCRHTFSWLADKYKMDPLSKRMIMGHSLGNDVEDNTYGHRTFQELKNEIEKIQPPLLPSN